MRGGGHQDVIAMEWSIHISGDEEAGATLRPGDINNFDCGLKLRPVLALTAQLIEEYFGPVRFTRCAYGNEFCEHLLPTVERLEAVVSAARRCGLQLTFLTPYVSDAGIEALKPLLNLLNKNGEPCEVVFNDWGVLNLIRREFSKVVPVQGRLLNKSLRDPRITGMYAATAPGFVPQAAVVSLRRSNLDCSSYAGFLSRMGVASVELDNLPQGVDLSFTENGLKANVYLPFGFISTSRICMAAGLHYQKKEKFQPGAPCQRECQTHLLEYSYTNSPLGNKDQKFYLKGNTYFYYHTEAMLRTLFEQARSGLINRLVFQPRLPMMWERPSKLMEERR